MQGRLIGIHNFARRSTGTQRGSFNVREFQRDPRECKDDSVIAAALLEDPLELKGDPLTYENYRGDPRECKDDSVIAAACWWIHRNIRGQLLGLPNGKKILGQRKEITMSFNEQLDNLTSLLTSLSKVIEQQLTELQTQVKTGFEKLDRLEGDIARLTLATGTINENNIR